MSSSIARVALDVPLDKLFDYRLRDGEDVPLGSLVVVPFGRQRQIGVVMELAEESAVPSAKLRRVESMVLDVAPLPAVVLELIAFCRDYYHFPIGQIAASTLPTRLRRPRAAAVHWRYTLSESGHELGEKSLARAPAKRQVIEYLRQRDHASEEELTRLSAGARRVVAMLVRAGHATREVAQRDLSRSDATALHYLAGPLLTEEQLHAARAIQASMGKFTAWLLHGVTSSGKTEVYFELIARALEQQQQVLLMLPEINLTPQLETRLLSRFAGLRLASLHSGLAEGDRCARWQDAARGAAQVVLGTRLAVFAPLPRLGLIIVDEEHDASFKQQEGLRYSARDLAIFIGQQRAITVVLGSATPSLETFRNAELGRYQVARLAQRASGAPPQMRLVDLRRQQLDEGLAGECIEALRACVQRGEQSLVYINRRGYAPALVCFACGWSAGCPRCAAKMVVHLKSNALRCHYCGHQTAVTRACPECGDQDLHPAGQGTQRIEETLQRLLPDARILRVDRDSTRNKDAWRTMRDAIAASRVDVLVGTQMLAKGHDFPALSLVVVINADGALFSTDFRAAERLYATLTQVAGRAGRADAPGLVLLQTAFPHHPLYQALLKDDFVRYARVLLDERRVAAFPPYVHQALLRAEALREQTVMDFLRAALDAARPVPEDVIVYDAVPASVPRVAGYSRAQVLIQAHSRRALQVFLKRWIALLSGERRANVRWSIDVDPVQV